MKKIVCLGIAFLMLFSAIGLSACDLGYLMGDLRSQIEQLQKQVQEQEHRIVELEEEKEKLTGEVAQLLTVYKDLVKAQLEVYAAAKGEENYFLAKWAEITGLVEEGKTAIDAATSKAGVDVAAEAMKEAIDAIKTLNESMGKFYSLQEAYELELLTREDIMHIVYYYRNSGRVVEVIDDSAYDYYEGYQFKWRYEYWKLPEEAWTVLAKVDFVPQIETPVIDTNVEQDIKLAYYEKYRESIYVDDGIGIVQIKQYLGEYNNCYAVEMYGAFDSGQEPKYCCLAGIVWWQPDFRPIEIFVF